MPRQSRKKHRLFASDAWQTIFDGFIASIPNANTRIQYESVLRRFFAFINQKYEKRTPTPDKIISADIEEFMRQPVQLGKKAGQTISPATHNTYLMALRSFYAYAGHAEIEYRGKMLPAIRKATPTATVKMRRTGEVERDFTDGELEAFFAQIDTDTLIGKRDRALFLALLCTGRRRREIATLRRGDLDMMTFMESGRMRHGWKYQYLGKWRVTKETAEMPLVCIEAIREWHKATGLDFDSEDKDQPLFFGLRAQDRRSEPMCLQQVDRRFKHYARGAGISDELVVHSLRYEYAWNRYCENGHDVLEVQDAVGWKSSEQAIHYIRRRRRNQRGDPMAERLSARFAHL